ncbi:MULTISPECIES: tRNA (5-methylaminomethyl-2-thiouridine)(34)-methyltransferase MnmD [Spirosoma]|uniref:MnmC-like methyltransferase domain-containing protein n=1 Tax=Spirosoma sordidisoli TaxID=2502893 RepID=A0A4Q2UIR0_9BACT|nr:MULTISPECIES: tRNA (5-methylaminomethyl-2-thiouridine)(34)-methyltransferase MnmD [Spirosoma]RYC67415.1 hypothetical protein EQG79_25250 [Spirosoma sordidisoli]
MKADVRLMVTADGSHTALSKPFDTTYHSRFGAFQESERVFIELGLQAAFDRFPQDELSILEMGFGTGLNALLTAREAEKARRRVRYTALEAYPMQLADAAPLNYDALLGTDYLSKLHQSAWNEVCSVSPFMTLTKVDQRLQDFSTGEQFHLIYYDAFAPSTQPELWELPIFEKLAHLLLPSGILTTYCSKSYVQRNLRAAGLVVDKQPGPARKREVLRAMKP